MTAFITKYAINKGQKQIWFTVIKTYNDPIELCYELANLGLVLDIKDAYDDLNRSEVYYNILVDGSYEQ